MPPRWVTDRGGGGENVVQLEGMNLHATGQEGGLEVLLSLGFVTERGGSSYSHSWHSLLIYGRKKIIVEQPPCVYCFGLLMTSCLEGAPSEAFCLAILSAFCVLGTFL